MPNLLSNIQTYGDTQMQIATAPLTAPPITAAPPAGLPTGWVALGWIDATGVSEAVTQNETKTYGWQGNSLLRILRTQFEHPFTFTALEENAVTAGLRNPAGTTITTGAIAEVQTITITGTGTAGTFSVFLPGYGTATGSAFNITPAALAAALSAAFGVTVTVSGTAGSSYVVTFPTTVGNIPAMQVNASGVAGATGATVAETTPGVAGSNVTQVAPASKVNIRQFAIDLISATVNHRYHLLQAEAVETGNVVYAGTNLSGRQFVCNPFLVNGRFYDDYNNNPALASGLFV